MPSASVAVLLLLLVVALPKVSGATGERATDTLKFVAFVCRHGNRGASEDYPLDPYPLSNTTYWPNGAQGLTAYGETQAYNLGVKMRSLYDGFLPTEYDNTTFYATSDSVARVITSGELVVEGLYNLTTYTISEDSPDKSVSVGMCSRKTSDISKTWSAFVTKDASNISSISSYIAEESNETLDASDLYDMYEKVLSEELEGYTLPDWLDEIYPGLLEDFYGKAFVAKNAGTNEVSRLYEGGLLDEVIATMDSVVNGTSERLMSFYSGHDSTISNFQITLGIRRSTMKRVVKPGSAIIVELHYDNTTYSVQVLYIDGTSSDLEPTSMKLKKCGSPCTYANFLESTAAFQGVDFSTECNSVASNSTSTSSTSTMMSSTSTMVTMSMSESTMTTMEPTSMAEMTTVKPTSEATTTTMEPTSSATTQYSGKVFVAISCFFYAAISRARL